MTKLVDVHPMETAIGPYLIYANEGDKTEHQRVSPFSMYCIVLNYNRANGNICTMKCSF